MKIAVTGAFGYSGRTIAHRLFQVGHGVIKPTNPPSLWVARVLANFAGRVNHGDPAA